MATETTIMPDASEIIHYDNIGVPIYVGTDDLSDYPGMRALCHWHEDIEFIHILKGRMYYRVNGNRVLLEEGDCLMVNARQMHYGYSYQKQDCTFSCVLFHPKLLAGNAFLYQKYILPFIGSSGPEFIHFCPQNPVPVDIAGYLSRTVELKKKALPGYELEIIGIMNQFWGRLLQESIISPGEPAEGAGTDLSLQRDMVSYIYQHYTEKVTLADIAAAGNVSRSKCCAIFKYYLQQSPIDFLNHYRLEASRSLLKKHGRSVTEVAVACGFNHLSYFSKLFLRSYHCTPSEYRKQVCGRPAPHR